jgi:opacity protein-like surface antigen
MKLKHLAMVTVLAAAPALALAQSSSRAGSNEFYISPIFTNSQSRSFDGGTTARTDDGYGFGVGFARNFTPNLSAGVELAWSQAYYRTTLQPVAGNPSAPLNSSGYIDTGSLRFVGTWNILTTPLTPFLTGGLGWTHVYTDLPSGPPQNSCWYYPWWGPVCTTYVPTQNTTKFAYNAGAGLRWDLGPYLIRGMALAQKLDQGGAQGDNTWTQIRFDFGMRFR